MTRSLAIALRQFAPKPVQQITSRRQRHDEASDNATFGAFGFGRQLGRVSDPAGHADILAGAVDGDSRHEEVGDRLGFGRSRFGSAHGGNSKHGVRTARLSKISAGADTMRCFS